MDNTNTKRQIEALPGVRYRQATLSDCESILALDPTFLNGMDYMPYRLPHYINDPNCVCGVMVTADDTVVAFIVVRIMDEGRVVYLGGLRVRADHRRHGYPVLLTAETYRVLCNMIQARKLPSPAVCRYQIVDKPWHAEQLARDPDVKVIDHRIITLAMISQRSLINLLSSPALAKQYTFNDVIKLTSSTQAYDVLSRNSHLLKQEFFYCLIEPYQLLKSNIDHVTSVVNSTVLATRSAQEDAVASNARADVIRGISTNVTFPCPAGIRHDICYYGSTDTPRIFVQHLLYSLANSDRIMSSGSEDGVVSNDNTMIFVCMILPQDADFKQMSDVLCNQLGFSMPQDDGTLHHLLVVELTFEHLPSTFTHVSKL